MNREAHCPSSRYVTGFDLNEARTAAVRRGRRNRGVHRL